MNNTIKNKTIKAILIDSAAQTFSEINVSNHYEYYKHLGWECTAFDVPLILDNGDSLFVDDEGLIHEIKGGFYITGLDFPIAGNGLLIGGDEEGDDVKTTIEDLTKLVTWISKEEMENHGDTMFKEWFNKSFYYE